jgi:hypothetical protein
MPKTNSVSAWLTSWLTFFGITGGARAGVQHLGPAILKASQWLRQAVRRQERTACMGAAACCFRHKKRRYGRIQCTFKRLPCALERNNDRTF